MTTLFYRFEQLRVKTENDDTSGPAITDTEQTFTFESGIFGIDYEFQNGISLSALYAMQVDDTQVDITIIKAGLNF